MQKAILKVEWRACWHLVLALSVAAFALPIVSVRVDWQGADSNLPLFLTELQLWGFFYPVLAVVAALIIALGIWAADRRGNHVYALLLPVPRSRYVLYRYAGGLVLLIPVVVALWLGAIVASGSIPLPPGIRVFPHQLSLKFAIVLLLMFGFAFALAAASMRTIGIAVRIAGVILAVHVAVLLIAPGMNLIVIGLKALATWPGPLSALAGRWMLIDA